MQSKWFYARKLQINFLLSLFALPRAHLPNTMEIMKYPIEIKAMHPLGALKIHPGLCIQVASFIKVCKCQENVGVGDIINGKIITEKLCYCTHHEIFHIN